MIEIIAAPLIIVLFILFIILIAPFVAKLVELWFDFVEDKFF